MPEIREVKTQQVDERCPKCGNGFMRPNGLVKTSNPPKYPHSCNAGCGHTADYGVRYPYIIHN